MAQNGGNDLFAEDGDVFIVTDLETGDEIEVEEIDFFIDENGDGFVFFDGVEVFSVEDVEDYEELEFEFYQEYSVD